ACCTDLSAAARVWPCAQPVWAPARDCACRGLRLGQLSLGPAALELLDPLEVDSPLEHRGILGGRQLVGIGTLSITRGAALLLVVLELLVGGVARQRAHAREVDAELLGGAQQVVDRKSTRLNSSH